MLSIFSRILPERPPVEVLMSSVFLIHEAQQNNQTLSGPRAICALFGLYFSGKKLKPDPKFKSEFPLISEKSNESPDNNVTLAEMMSELLMNAYQPSSEVSQGKYGTLLWNYNWTRREVNDEEGFIAEYADFISKLEPRAQIWISLCISEILRRNPHSIGLGEHELLGSRFRILKEFTEISSVQNFKEPHRDKLNLRDITSNITRGEQGLRATVYRVLEFFHVNPKTIEGKEIIRDVLRVVSSILSNDYQTDWMDLPSLNAYLKDGDELDIKRVIQVMIFASLVIESPSSIDYFLSWCERLINGDNIGFNDINENDEPLAEASDKLKFSLGNLSKWIKRVFK